MTRRILFPIFLAFSLFLFLSCGGVEPTPEDIGATGFSGKITFVGNWPEGILRTHIAAFKNPILSENDFSSPNLSIILRAIEYGASEFNYNSIDDTFLSQYRAEPGEYRYVVVAQSKTRLCRLNGKTGLLPVYIA